MYHIYEDNRKKQSILFIHLFPASHRVFKNHFKLYRSEFNILAVDLPGFGESPPLEEFSITEVVNQIEGLLSQLGLVKESVYIYGASFGGVIALNLARRNKYRGIIIESSPLCSESINSNTSKLLNSIKLMVRTFKAEALLDRLKERQRIAELVVGIHDIIKKGGGTTWDNGDLVYFAQKSKTKTVFEVHDYLLDYNLELYLKGIDNYVIGIYDKEDPIIDFRKSRQNLKRLCSSYEIVSCDYGCHVPSLNHCDEMTRKCQKSLKKLRDL